MDGRTDDGQVAQLAAPELGRNAGDAIHGGEHEVPEGGRCADSGGTDSNQTDHVVLDLPITVDDQLLLGLNVVVHRLLGDLSVAGDVADRDALVPPLGEQPGRDIGDEPTRAHFLELS